MPSVVGVFLWLVLISGCAVDAPKQLEPSLDAGLEIRLSDGVTLAADVMRPSGSGRYPTILEITPYGRGPDALNYSNESGTWNERGYAFVIVDSRGQGDSGGDFAFFSTSGDDGRDVVEWIAEQPWSNGKVAMRGSSYTGTNQLLTATRQPPPLSCITPSATGNGPGTDLPYRWGVHQFRWSLTWPAELSDAGVDRPESIAFDALLGHRPLMTADEVVYGRPLQLFRTFLEHPPTDEAWRQLRLTEHDYARIDMPSLSFSGWFDGTLPGTIAHYRAMRAHSPVPDRHYLVIGPWEHMSAPDGGYNYLTGEPITRVGDIELPEQAFLPGFEMTSSFYDWCLKGEGDFDQAPVKIYLTGSHRWLDLPTYPPPTSRCALSTCTAPGTPTLPRARACSPGTRPAKSRPTNTPSTHSILCAATTETLVVALSKRPTVRTFSST